VLRNEIASGVQNNHSMCTVAASWIATQQQQQHFGAASSSTDFPKF
jgi:hypothetical protein